ncbi:PEP-CTERM sorting domain-containing protein [Massilia dura]|uniref:PEP-CTERM sorting domain-containing protein n=2 Tax=Pseudoduganella dura TaxID=321982 RepID=A0A6I3X7B0_9BURK|nr:PEP-CTERM sorting domain-containing protein [Pseudoduganella dura]GGX96885.1 hypothetical protein GCM10007386_29800 [Pseudoduganella dura]
MKLFRFAPIAALLCSSLSHAAIANSASVYLHTEPGSYVGGGIGVPEVTWTHGDQGIFFSSANYGTAESGVQISYDGGDSWTFQFAAPSYNPVTNTNDGQALQAGFYDRATRFPFNSPTRPGLDVSGNGRGNNRLYGWFNVLEISYGVTGDLESFAVDFRQYDEANGPYGPSLYGSLRFNSDIAINPVPEPATYAMLAGGLALVGFAARRRRKEVETV